MKPEQQPLTITVVTGVAELPLITAHWYEAWHGPVQAPQQRWNT